MSETADPQLARAMRRAQAPFGRFGAALGFRWIFPVGTLPLPYHPLLAALLLLAVPALLLHRLVATIAGSGEGIGWPGLLIGAGLTAIPMTIPFVSWLGMALRLPLIQGLMIGGAMLLIALDVATGAAPAWAALAPAAFVALYAAQRIGGPIALRRIEAANAAFAPVDPGDRLVIVERDRVASSYADWLHRHCDIARVAVEPDANGRSKLSEATYYRLTQEDAARIAARIEGLRPQGWRAGKRHVVVPEVAEPGALPPVRIRESRHHSPFWLLGGGRSRLEIDEGGRVQRLVGGEAELVSNIPLFVFFYWLAILGGSSRWVAGFWRRRPVTIGTARIYDMLARAFPPLTDGGGRCADPAPLMARLDALEAERGAEAQALLDALLDSDAELPQQTLPIYRRLDLAHGRGRALCARLRTARDASQAGPVRLCAELIATLPPEEFRSLSGELLTLLNSKLLAYRVVDSNDPAVLALSEQELRKHNVRGFSLVLHVPSLYRRLAELGEPARPLIIGLGRIADWPEPLATARDALDAARSG